MPKNPILPVDNKHTIIWLTVEGVRDRRLDTLHRVTNLIDFKENSMGSKLGVMSDNSNIT